MKTNTALLYDKNFKHVEEWGYPALIENPRNSKENSKNRSLSKPTEFFKIHLHNIPENEKPGLPKGLTYEKAITDYLKSMGKILVYTKFLMHEKL